MRNCMEELPAHCSRGRADQKQHRSKGKSEVFDKTLSEYAMGKILRELGVWQGTAQHNPG